MVRPESATELQKDLVDGPIRCGTYQQSKRRIKKQLCINAERSCLSGAGRTPEKRNGVLERYPDSVLLVFVEVQNVTILRSPLSRLDVNIPRHRFCQTSVEEGQFSLFNAA